MSAAPSSSTPSATSLLGDTTTLDPCSLVPSDLPGPTVPYNVAGCMTYVTIPNGALWVTVYFGLSADLSRVTSGATRHGALTVVDRPGESASSCERDIFYDPHDAIAVTAQPDSGVTVDSATLCQHADTVTSQVIGVLDQHAVAHLSWPAGSLGSIDMCGLLTPAQVQAATGATDGTTMPTDGKHACNWGTFGSPVVTAYGNVMLGPDPMTPSDGGTQTTIAGRLTVVDPVAGQSQSSCSVATLVDSGPWPGRITQTDSGSSQVTQYAMLRTMMTGSAQQACQAAQQLAADAWPRLPAAH